MCFQRSPGLIFRCARNYDFLIYNGSIFYNTLMATDDNRNP